MHINVDLRARLTELSATGAPWPRNRSANLSDVATDVTSSMPADVMILRTCLTCGCRRAGYLLTSLTARARPGSVEVSGGTLCGVDPLCHGGQVGCCGTRMDARDITEAMITEGAKRSTMDELTDGPWPRLLLQRTTGAEHQVSGRVPLPGSHPCCPS